MRSVRLLLAGSLLFPALYVPAQAQAQAQDAEPNAQGELAVTIYNNNLALIQDKRQLNLPNGRSRQEFADVSAMIRPETATLETADATIIEQNFDYDLLTPEKLMQKSLGRQVTLVDRNPQTGVETSQPATVLSTNNGTVLRVGSQIRVLSSYDNTRVVFSSLPPNLRARPTLSVTLDADRGGARPATLSYLSNGFGWKADYVALFDEGKGVIDVQGWVTLTNNTGTSFRDAATVLVAGTPAGTQPDYSRGYQPPSPPGNRPGTESADRERLGDFYLYPLAGRTTIANAQQKQVSFLDVGGAPAAKAYYYRNPWLQSQSDPVSFATVLRFSSSREGGLGDALPAGTVRVYMRDAKGSPQFIGENQIGHTPMGSSLAIRTGEAFDVKVKPIVDKRDRITSGEWEQSARYRISDKDGTRTVTVDSAVTYYRTQMRYVLTNARPSPVTVEIAQAGLDSWWGDTRVPSESVKGEQVSADERLWKVTVPANGEATLSVTFDTRY